MSGIGTVFSRAPTWREKVKLFETERQHERTGP